MSKESYIINCIRRLREYGEGIVLADQLISSLKNVVKSNVYTIISLSQSSQKDRREVAAVLGLNPQQSEVTNRLEPGEGIIRLAGRFPYPQLLKIPFAKPKNLSDKKLDQSNKNDELIQTLLSNVKTRHLFEQTKDDKFQVLKDQKQGLEKTDRSKDVPLDMYNRFDVSSTQRASDLGLSASESDKIYKWIEKEQLAEPVWLNLTGKRGGLSKYHGLTKKGLEYICKPSLKQSGGTGTMHFFLERYLKKHLPEKGFRELEIEKNINGKRLDLFGRYEGQKVGVEICVSTIKTEHVNAQNDISTCDLLFIVCPDKKTKDKLEKEIYKKIEPTNKLKICQVHELLNRADEMIQEMNEKLFK